MSAPHPTAPLPEGSGPGAVAGADRLVSLLVALRASPGGMTGREVIEHVHGYSGRADASSFRTLERDKAALRQLGVPLRVEGEGPATRYLLQEEDLAGRQLVEAHVDAQDLAVLAVAARAWREGQALATARTALTKLTAAAGLPAGPPAAGEEDRDAGAPGQGTPADLTLPRLRLPGHEVTGALLDAVSQRRVVEMDYQSVSSGRLRRRRVEPWRLYVRDGAWYLLGRDLTADHAAHGAADGAGPGAASGQAPGTETGTTVVRSFRLTRVRGRVRAVGRPGAFAVPPAPPRPSGGTGSGAVAGGDDTGRHGCGAGAHRARIAVRPGRAAGLRLQAQGEAQQPGAAEPVTVAVGAPASAGPARASVPAGAGALETWDTVVLTYDAWELRSLAGRLAGLAEDVVVLGPPELARAVRDNLEVVADLCSHVPQGRTVAEPEEVADGPALDA